MSVAGVLAFLALALPRLRHLGFLRLTLLTFVLLAALKETLRGAIMNGVVMTGWLFSAITLVQPLVRVLIVAAVCVFAMRWVRSGTWLIAIALVAGAITIGANMLTGIVLAPLTARFAALSRPDLYDFPYPLQVMIPAYLTFLEPLIATVAMAALVWPKLPGSRFSRVASFAALVARTTGMVGLPVYGLSAPSAVGTTVLSYSQFLFEYLALGLLAGAAWEAFGPARTPRAGLGGDPAGRRE